MLTHRQGLLYALATEIPEYLHLPVPIRDALLSETVLRDYQLDLLRRASALMRQGYRRVLLVLPTGGGKTVLAAEALKSAAASGFRGQFLVHRKELIDQTSLSFAKLGLPHGFIAAGRPLDLAAPTTLAGVGTLVRRLDIALPGNLLICDEAHHARAETWERVFAAHPDTFILGLTATPERLDGRGLDAQFDVMIEGPTVADLIGRGFLSPFDYYAPSLPDMSGVRTEQQAEAIMDQPDLIGDMVEHYLRLAAGQPGIVFAHSVAHSKHLVDAYAAHGVRAAHIDGDMSDKERERVDAMFRARDVDILSNCALLGEGYDVPGVVYCGMGRRTKSLAWFRQMGGRALRPIYEADADLSSDASRVAAIAAGPKPRAIICDHASNVFTHGFPDDDVEWSLEGRAPRARSAAVTDVEPVRQCGDCFRVYPSVLAACPGCGTERQATPREIKQREGELEKLERDALKRRQAAEKKAAEKSCSSYGDFYDLAVARGYAKPAGWAAMRMKLKENYGSVAGRRR